MHAIVSSKQKQYKDYLHPIQMTG